MGSARLTESMITYVLQNESNDGRFEDFSIELFRDVDQREYARTSASWDHGRDGLDVSPKSWLCAAVHNSHNPREGRVRQGCA